MIIPITYILSHTRNPTPVHTLLDYLIAITGRGNKLAVIIYRVSLLVNILTITQLYL